jgi:AmmeMemoRadiSam system protein B
MRRPTAGYYPHSQPRLRRQLSQLLADAPDRDLTPDLAIAPHGSLQVSGNVAAAVYDAIDFSQYRNAVILGAKHRDIGPKRAVSTDTWKTPLGEIEVDRTFIDQLTTRGVFERSERAHSHETSIEMQALFLQYCWDDVTIAPLLIDNDLSEDQHRETVDAVRSALNPSDLLIVGTDLVHYGVGRYYPDTTDPQQEVKQRDIELINSLKEYDIEAIEDKSGQYHVCGRGPLLSAMEAVGKKDVCHVLGHTTSFKSGSDNRTVTGYGGICYT